MFLLHCKSKNLVALPVAACDFLRNSFAEMVIQILQAWWAGDWQLWYFIWSILPLMSTTWFLDFSSFNLDIWPSNFFLFDYLAFLINFHSPSDRNLNYLNILNNYFIYVALQFSKNDAKRLFQNCKFVSKAEMKQIIFIIYSKHLIRTVGIQHSVA